MPEISPEEVSAMQAQEGKDDGMGQVTKLAQDVGQGLAKLSDLLNSSDAATDEDRAQMSEILNSFVDLVEKKLGAAPGQNPEEEEVLPAGNAVSMQGGLKGKPMGPESRM